MTGSEHHTTRINKGTGTKEMVIYFPCTSSGTISIINNNSSIIFKIEKSQNMIFRYDVKTIQTIVKVIQSTSFLNFNSIIHCNSSHILKCQVSSAQYNITIVIFWRIVPINDCVALNNSLRGSKTQMIAQLDDIKNPG